MGTSTLLNLYFSWTVQHTDPAITEATKTDTKYINAGMTPLSQFLDTHLNKPFKDSLRDRWEEWLDNGEKEYTRNGNRKRASYEMVATWASDAWKEVATDEIIEWHGDRAQLHSRLRETIESRDVPAENPEEVDQLISEMREIEKRDHQ